MVENGVGFTKPDLFIIPVPEGSDGNLLFEEGPGLSGGGSPGFVLFPFPAQHPLHGGTADLYQFCLYLREQVELDGQGFQVLPDHGDQAFTAEAVEEVPDGKDGLFHRFVVDFPVEPFLAAGGDFDVHRLFAYVLQLDFSRVMEGNGVLAVGSRA